MRPIVLQRYGENLLTIDNILSEGMVSGCKEDCETTERERENLSEHLFLLAH